MQVCASTEVMKKRSYAETNAYRNLLNPSADPLDKCRKSITIYGYLKTWNNTYKRGCKMHYNDCITGM